MVLTSETSPTCVDHSRVGDPVEQALEPAEVMDTEAVRVVDSDTDGSVHPQPKKKAPNRSAWATEKYGMMY